MDENGTSTDPSIGDQVKQQTQQVVQQGQQIAGQVVEKARGQVKDQISTQKSNLAGSLGNVAQVLQSTSSQLRDQGVGVVGDYSDRIAEQVTRVSTYLNEREVDQLVEDVNNYARSQPVIFLSGAVLLGVMAARFLKSSGQTAASLEASAAGNYGGSGYGSYNGSGTGYEYASAGTGGSDVRLSDGV